jgi:hypothetical protein
MSSIASVANTVDWLSGAWSSIQGSSSSSGNAIVDAASGSGASAISGGFSDADFNALSSTLTSVAQNFVQEENILVAQKAVARVQSEAAAKLKAVSSQAALSSGRFVNKTA